jgi:hypothetical protein
MAHIRFLDRMASCFSGQDGGRAGLTATERLTASIARQRLRAASGLNGLLRRLDESIPAGKVHQAIPVPQFSVRHLLVTKSSRLDAFRL